VSWGTIWQAKFAALVAGLRLHKTTGQRHFCRSIECLALSESELLMGYQSMPLPGVGTLRSFPHLCVSDGFQIDRSFARRAE
jgi:hypothetical protein